MAVAGLALAGAVVGMERQEEVRRARPLLEEGYEVRRAERLGADVGAVKRVGGESRRSGSAPAAAGGLRLSLAECIRRGLEENLDVQLSAAEAEVASQEVQLARAEFDPQFFAEGWADYSGGAAGRPFGLGGVSQRLITGTEVTAEFGQVPARTGDFRDDFLNASTSDGTVRVRQPLLRGAGWGVNGTGIRLGQLTRQKADAAHVAQVLEMLRTVETAYFAAAVEAAVEESHRQSVVRTEGWLFELQTRQQLGHASELDLLEAEVALAAARERHLSAMKSRQEREDALWSAIGGHPEQRPTRLRLDVLAPESLPKGRPAAATHIARALSTASTAVLLLNEVQVRELELARARNAALPQVDLEFNAASARGSAAGGWEGVGLLRVALPWGFRAERAQLAQARARLERSRLAREQAERRLKEQISSLCRAIALGREVLAAAEAAAAAREKKRMEEQRQHREGLIPMQDLRLSEQELQDALTRVQAARLDLLSAWSHLTQLDATIAARHGILL